MSVNRNGRLSVVYTSNNLEYYDSNKKLATIQEWYTMVRTPPDERNSVKQLEDEAKNMSGKPDSRMRYYLERAKEAYFNKYVLGLTSAECLVVLMYTNDNNERAFFREYNRASTNGNWKPYRVYTALLTSAIRKLAKTNPLPADRPLYRGLSSRLNPPTAKRIFWKSFTSATLNFHVAVEFAAPDGIILEFQPPASPYAAQVGSLSSYAEEEEVILLPFEAFDFTMYGDRHFYFKSSKTQELLRDYEGAAASAYESHLYGL